jgi:hypothetical protein
MDFDSKVTVLGGLMSLRDNADDRLMDWFASENNDLAVRYAVGVDVGHIHQLSTEAELMVDKAYYDLLADFGADLDGDYENVWDILPEELDDDGAGALLREFGFDEYDDEED